MADLVEDRASDLGRGQQVRVGLDAEADARRLRLVGDLADVRLEGRDLLGRLGVAGERVQDLDAQLLTGAKHVREPALADLLVERRVAAHRDAGEPVLREEPPAAFDVWLVRVDVLEEALDGADLHVLEAGLGKAAKRLLERVGQEDDRRPGLDPAHVLSSSTRDYSSSPAPTSPEVVA